MRILLLLMFLTCSLYAQSEPDFKYPAMLCENQWVALPKDSTGQYMCGFIYYQVESGYSIHMGNKFIIDELGRYIRMPGRSDSLKYSMKIRIKAQSGLFAILTKDQRAQLELPAEPSWFAPYRADTNSVKDLYGRAFNYDALGLCSLALPLLERALLLDSNYKGLRSEMAFACNCMGRYEQAIRVVRTAYDTNPSNSYLSKELIFAQLKTGDLKGAAETCKRCVAECQDTSYHDENTYNVLYEFFLAKDVENFDAWLMLAKRWNT